MREVEMKYPTGVENHGGKLRIWFVYKGVESGKTQGSWHSKKQARCRWATRLCLLRNKNWCFRLCKTVSLLTQSGKIWWGPTRFNHKRTGWKISGTERNWSRKNITQHIPCRHQKYPEHNRWKNLASSINKEKLLEVRKELLTGYQIPKSNYIVTQPGDRL